MGVGVYLGEAMTDGEQRLTVLGGKGVSASIDGSAAITFANNEGWYDDVSDGPVTARLKLNGEEIQVIPAWVVVAPPNYGRAAQVGADDVGPDARRRDQGGDPRRPRRARRSPATSSRCSSGWKGCSGSTPASRQEFGWEGVFDLTSASALARLGSTSPARREQRRVIYNNFRNFDTDANSPVPWPWLYGDAMNIPPVASPRQNSVLGDLPDGDAVAVGRRQFRRRPRSGRPAAGEHRRRAAGRAGRRSRAPRSRFCLADAFHPGCEMTWPVRAATMYMAPFRFGAPCRAGSRRSRARCSRRTTSPSPWVRSTARWPAASRGGWQCHGRPTPAAAVRGYTASYDPMCPRSGRHACPGEVLTKENYDIVMDKSRPLSERRKAFANREAWIEPLGADGYAYQINA